MFVFLFCVVCRINFNQTEATPALASDKIIIRAENSFS